MKGKSAINFKVMLSLMSTSVPSLLIEFFGG